MNRNLIKAKASKMDEFYTQLTDVEKEMRHYTDHFKGKVVYSNCDREDSAFVKFFKLKKDHLGLKDFIHYDGDFRSPESIALLEMADIVVTNPPFSLFREYVAQLVEHDKKFLVIGHIHAFTYKEIWPLFKDGKIWMGCNGTGRDKWFHVPDGYPKRKGRWAIDKDGRQMSSMGNVCWYTNLSHSKRKDASPIYKSYIGNESYYPMYDNERAIECSKVKDIPCDFYGMIGVPISYIEKHDPDEFELVRLFTNAKIEGINKYTRILIKRRRQAA